jgi:ketosteroid isomerase-like protein
MDNRTDPGRTGQEVRRGYVEPVTTETDPATNWERVFAAYECPLGYEVCELALAAGEDVAFAHSINRLSGTLKNGTQTTGFWVRATMCFRRNGAWVIAHDQVSVPLDVATGAALLNLQP